MLARMALGECAEPLYFIGSKKGMKMPGHLLIRRQSLEKKKIKWFACL
jgi:hypothetical protein